jgi:hypothetical protein
MSEPYPGRAHIPVPRGLIIPVKRNIGDHRFGQAILEKEFHFLGQPSPQNNVALIQPEPPSLPDQNFFPHMKSNQGLQLVRRRRSSGLKLIAPLQHGQIGLIDMDAVRLAAVQHVDSEESEPDQSKHCKSVRQETAQSVQHVRDSSARKLPQAGAYQIGEDQARS